MVAGQICLATETQVSVTHLDTQEKAWTNIWESLFKQEMLYFNLR